MRIVLPNTLKPPGIIAPAKTSIRLFARLSRRFKIIICLIGLCTAFLITIAIKGFFATPDLTLLNNSQQASLFFDASGKPLRGFCTPPFCREVIPLSEMGEFPRFVIAAEDKHFWNRLTAYDIERTIYVFSKFIVTLSKEHGGASTITQQLSRITSLTAELIAEREKKTFGALLWRKGREMWIAAYLETHLKRKEILEHYLNNVWCGERHGVQLCSRVLFGKPANEIKFPRDIDKIALFTGLLRKPSASPFRNPEQAKAVRSRVLVQFENEGLITEEQRKWFDHEPLPTSRIYFCESGHFNEFLRQQLTENGRLVNQGLRIQTTLDCDMQNAAQKALRTSMDAMIKRNSDLAEDLRGLALMIDRKGAIKVFAQEPGFNTSQYPLTKTWRQAGSAYKPVAYGAMTFEFGLRWSCKDEGKGPCLLRDSPGLSIKMGKRQWKQIRNFDNLRLADYAGMVTPLQALAESRNAATMSAVAGVYGGISHRVTVEQIMKFAAGIKIPFPTRDVEMAKNEGLRLLGHEALAIGIPTNTIHPGLTVAIGSVEVTPDGLAKGYSALAFGEAVEPFGIETIKNTAGNVIIPQKTESEKVFEKMYREKLRREFYKVHNNDLVRDLSKEEERKIEEQAKTEAKRFWYTMLRGLRATAEIPTGTAHTMFKNLGFQICGKTGTATNAEGESTDNWFVGCTPSYVIVVWIGRDKKHPMPNTFEENKVKDKEGNERIIKTKIQETGGRNARIVAEKVFKIAYAKRPKEFFPPETDPIKPFVFYERVKANQNLLDIQEF